MEGVINRAYVVDAIKRCCPVILTREQIYDFIEEARNLNSVKKNIALFGVEDLNNMKRQDYYDRQSNYDFIQTVENTDLPPEVQAEYAIFWFSFYVCYEAVAHPWRVYRWLQYCLKKKILF